MATADQSPDSGKRQSNARFFWRALAYFVALALVNTAGYRGLDLALSGVTPAWVPGLAESLAYLAGVLALTWAFCHFFDHKPVADLGLHRQGSLVKLAAGLGLGILLQVVIFAALALAGWLSVERAPWQPVELSISILSWLVISFNEELAFRGYIMQRLSLAWGMPAAVIASSLVFAAVHLLNPNFQPLAFVSLFAAGLLLAAAYLVSKSLWLPIGLHIAWNLMEVQVFGFPGSGITEPALLRSAVHGPELLAGGAFGPEGGLVGIAAPLVGIAILLIAGSIIRARKAHI